MTRDEILADLKEQYGRQLVLSPPDIALAIGRSPKAQANMRSRGVFPIPVKRAGGKVGVSIYDLADYLAGEQPTPGPSAPAQILPAVRAKVAAMNEPQPGKPGAPKPPKTAAKPTRAAPPAAWLPARRRKSLGPELLGFRQALDFWGAVHAELEAAELAFLTRPRGD